MGVHLQSWLSTDLRPDKLIMQKNYEQNTATGWHYQAQEASQSYAQSPQLPPSYDQATYVHSTPPTVEPTTTTQVVIIQRRFIAVSFCVALAFLLLLCCCSLQNRRNLQWDQILVLLAVPIVTYKS